MTGSGGLAAAGARRAAAWLAAWPLAFVLAVAAPGARADEPRFEVRSAAVQPEGGVWYLNARLELGLTSAAAEAVLQGIPITVELEVEITTQRRFLPDDEVASLAQRWRVEYHALTERYLITNLNSGEQAAFPTLAAALGQLEQLRRLPILDMALVETGRRYEISTRASVEIGGLPETVKALMFWREWKRSTGWYTWTVRG